MSDLESEGTALGRLREGDISGLETLVRLYQTRALRLAYGITGTREEAEDVVMDAFIVAFERIDQLDPSRPFAPWFQRLVVNRSISFVRSTQRRARIWVLLGRSQPSEANPADVAETRDLRNQLVLAFADLTPEERAVAIMRLAFEMTEKDTATALGWRIGTVKSRLARARRKLRRRFTNPVAFATSPLSKEI
jgi:RNA polymerase sigma factor (sigma-70 family)